MLKDDMKLRIGVMQRGLSMIYIHILLKYYTKKHGLGEIIDKDAVRMAEYYKRKSNCFVKERLFLSRECCFRDVVYFRLKHKCRMLCWFYKPYPNLVIDDNVQAMGGGFLFHHPFSTYINATFVGYGCVFRNNTTIGNKVVKGKLCSPVLLGNNDIGVNSCVIGNVTVGKNSIIGAGSVVVKDVPENTVVAGNPAQMIKIID